MAARSSDCRGEQQGLCVKWKGVNRPWRFSLKWETPESRRDEHILKLVKKVIKGKMPTVCKALFYF